MDDAAAAESKKRVRVDAPVMKLGLVTFIAPDSVSHVLMNIEEKSTVNELNRAETLSRERALPFSSLDALLQRSMLRTGSSLREGESIARCWTVMVFLDDDEDEDDGGDEMQQEEEREPRE